MLNFIKRFIRDHKGVAAVEFALYLPMLLIMVVGMSEVGFAIVQSTIVEKSLRSGAIYAARSELPLTTTAQTKIANIVKNGNMTGSGDYLISGWSSTDASLSITVSNYTISADSSVLGSNQLPVITITARVPYLPIFGTLMNQFGMGGYMITLSHEQAHFGV
ncbi:hypothetical protein A9Q83_16920 [Alphaproteobacteria bacterium 46_93_T64]|nr:hypothetical protein A9Q83_16920 [Alphaproteobacteria bacterium 46_93_T64]